MIQQLCFHWRCEGVSLCKSGRPEATPRYHVAAISSKLPAKLQRIGTYSFQIKVIYLLSFSVFIEYKLETYTTIIKTFLRTMHAMETLSA